MRVFLFCALTTAGIASLARAQEAAPGWRSNCAVRAGGNLDPGPLNCSIAWGSAWLIHSASIMDHAFLSSRSTTKHPRPCGPGLPQWPRISASVQPASECGSQGRQQVEGALVVDVLGQGQHLRQEPRAVERQRAKRRGSTARQHRRARLDRAGVKSAVSSPLAVISGSYRPVITVDPGRLIMGPYDKTCHARSILFSAVC